MGDRVQVQFPVLVTYFGVQPAHPGHLGLPCLRGSVICRAYASCNIPRRACVRVGSVLYTGKWSDSGKTSWQFGQLRAEHLSTVTSLALRFDVGGMLAPRERISQCYRTAFSGFRYAGLGFFSPGDNWEVL